jgi:streptogramin lyase
MEDHMPRPQMLLVRRSTVTVGTACALMVATMWLATGHVPSASARVAPHASTPAAFTVREYLLPHANAFAHDPAVGADGIVWFADQRASYIGRLDPETGDV